MKIVRAAWSLWARLLLLLIGALCTPVAVVAQTPQQTALARTLFEEGVKLADRGDWVSAADRFERAYSLKPTSGIAFNWARAQQETGHLLHAQELLRGVARDPAASPSLKSESEVLLEKLEARTAHLRIITAWKADEDTAIEVDGTSWPRAAWGYASPIDPGNHAIVGRQDGEEVARADIVLREGETKDLSLTSEAARDLEPSAGASSTDERPRKPLYKNWILWTAVGAVVVGGVVIGAVVASRGDLKPSAPVTGNAMPGVIHW